MAFELRRRKHIDGDLVKIVRRELRHAARDLAAAKGDSSDAAVHRSRKIVKKVRAVASFLEEAGAKVPHKDRKRLKAAAKALSTLRDSVAIIETFDRVRRRYPTQLSEHTYSRLRRGLLDARDREQQRAEQAGTISRAARRLATTSKSARRWTSPSITASGIGQVVTAPYRQNRAAMERAQMTRQSTTLHSWRKVVKTLWCQMQVSKPLMRGAAPFVADLEKLATLLGDDHNLVVLVATLRLCPELRTMSPDIRTLGRLALRMRQQLRRRAFEIGGRLYVRTPNAFGRWIESCVTTPSGARLLTPHGRA